MKLKTQLTLENFKEGKYKVSHDCKAYRDNEKGEIEDLGSIDNVTLEQIGNYIKEQFNNEVDKITGEWQEKFISEYQNHYDKKYLQEAEIETVNQILRGQKNTITDSFGISHEIISYINGMPISFEEGQLKLSPALAFHKYEIEEIRRYMVYEYNRPKQIYEYVQNPHYYYLSRCWILAEALIKYQIFLKGYSQGKKSNPKEYDSIHRARAFYIYLMFLGEKITKEDMESKSKLISIIDKEFHQSGKTSARQTYDELNSKDYISLNYTDLKEKYKPDFEYGQKLSVEKYQKP